MKVLWTPKAILSLKATAEFLDKIWKNQSILDTFLIEIDKAILQIQKYPASGVKFHDNIRRILIHKNVSLFYKEESNLLKILLIWDNRQNPDELEGKLKSDKSS